MPSTAPKPALRPSAADALAAWRVLVSSEREQTESLPNRPRPEDFYAPIAQAFRDDPYRKDDPLLELLRPLARRGRDLAGPRRRRWPLHAALALAGPPRLRRRALRGHARATRGGVSEHGRQHRDVRRALAISPSDAPIADVGFMSQVGYDIEDIGPFVDQLEAHTDACAPSCCTTARRLSTSLRCGRWCMASHE